MKKTATLFEHVIIEVIIEHSDYILYQAIQLFLRLYFGIDFNSRKPADVTTSNICLLIVILGDETSPSRTH